MPMSNVETTTFVRGLMMDFAARTGLTGTGPPVRYLWTDAFALCNFLTLAHRTGDPAFRGLALALVDQVHRVLGRHRGDDERSGWISGLTEAAGAEHPTIGGLRIGKRLPERRRGEPIDERLEWDQDGQYFHYLTRWMHALARLGRVTGDGRYIRWGLELAVTAYDRFSYPTTSGPRRMVWKMSVDLSRPLVDSMGQHDAIDGLITCLELRAAAETLDVTRPAGFDATLAGLTEMSRGTRLATADPLGTGGLLTAAHTLAQLIASGATGVETLFVVLLEEATPGLEYQMANDDALSMPPDYRLAFRELGLAIGLHAAARMQALIDAKPATFRSPAARSGAARLMRHASVADAIEAFWVDPGNRAARSWREHEDINAVMLATSLAPDGYLAL